ncbi:MAG: hypothetical protein J7K85_08210 [Anaerolineaceae bacterium]|nr:hypothetical protein [Anaerolineaceae bacterium]
MNLMGSVEELKESFDSFMVTWNTLLAHPFRWSYDGKGLHKKSVGRFTDMLLQAASKFEISSLTKQLKLMSNLLSHYFSEVPMTHWGKLYHALLSQKTVLRNIIMKEEGPLKKKNADSALNEILFALENYTHQNILKAA